MSYELENIRRWYDDKTYTHEQIIAAIHSSESKCSVKYVERILTQAIPKLIEIDQEVEDAFAAAEKDSSLVKELGILLQKRNVFSIYEDRFFSLIGR